MSTAPATLYACIHAAEFPAQALLRLRDDLHSEPIAVLKGPATQEFVCSINQHALRRGVALGMTRLDLESYAGLKLLLRSPQTEVAARAVLLECASKFSPRIEAADEGSACAFVLDITGMERLFGPPAQLAERLRSAIASAGFRVSIAISANFHTARIKAFAARGLHIVPPGQEAAALAKISLDTLPIGDDHRETLAGWGIRTLGELAALPEVDLISRLGQQAHAWRQTACGSLPHMFQPIEAEFVLREFCAFEDPVEQMEALLFMGARMIDRLVARAADRALSLALITARMKLEGDQSHQLLLRPAIASADRKFLLKLLQLELAAHPPQAAVLSLELTAEAGHASTVQLGLFTPQTPEPSRLDVTLARLKAIVGEERVGRPVLEDSHRAGSFRMDRFSVNVKTPEEGCQCTRMALRRMRPPLPVRVDMRDLKPVTFRDRENRFLVTAAYGPWRSSGCWWSAGEWNVEEWDVLAERSDGASLACLLVCDQGSNQWRLEAFYD